MCKGKFKNMYIYAFGAVPCMPTENKGVVAKHVGIGAFARG